MTQAIFRETDQLVTPKRSRLADLEPVDVGAGLGFVAVTAGLGMVALPLAFIIPGSLVLVVCLWRILRVPRGVR